MLEITVPRKTPCERITDESASEYTSYLAGGLKLIIKIVKYPMAAASAVKNIEQTYPSGVLNSSKRFERYMTAHAKTAGMISHSAQTPSISAANTAECNKSENPPKNGPHTAVM